MRRREFGSGSGRVCSLMLRRDQVERFYEILCADIIKTKIPGTPSYALWDAIDGVDPFDLPPDEEGDLDLVEWTVVLDRPVYDQVETAAALFGVSMSTVMRGMVDRGWLGKGSGDADRVLESQAIMEDFRLAVAARARSQGYRGTRVGDSKVVRW